MDLCELQNLLANCSENEHVEFKEATNTFSLLGSLEKRRSVYGYAVAMGNELGGKLILGVDDNKNIVGTKSFLNLESVKSDIYKYLKKRIEIDEIFDEVHRRVLVIHFPTRNVGEILKFHGIPLMRVGEELVPMDDRTQRIILLEQDQDFSAQIVPDLLVQDLSAVALEEFQRLFNEKNKSSVSAVQLLTDLGLQTPKGITYAALILLGSTSLLSRYLANNEIVFQYRNNSNQDDYQDRVDYRNAFLLVQRQIWDKISSRNQIAQIQEGFLTREISAFNEKVIKESVLNAITHRDYRDCGSIIIKQSPQAFEIQSPGGLLPGVTTENILKQTKPRNRLLAEVLQHLGFVQRAGQGMDTIFRETLNEGKGFPDLSDSDDYQVTLRVSAQVKNAAFLTYLERVLNEKQASFSVNDLILLQSIEDNGDNLKKESIQKFLDLGIVEQSGKTRGSKYILSHHYYKTHGKTGEYTRIVGLKRETKKALILQHLNKNKGGAVLNEFAQAFPEMSRGDISNLLQELKNTGDIKVEGITRHAKWKLNQN